MTIKLPDPSRSGGSDDTDDIRELVPWYVNGTLPEHEARRVEDRAAADPEIAQDIRQQRSLAQRVATEDPFDVPLKQSWEKLRAEAMADISARSPAVQPWHRRVTERFEGRAAAIFGTVALACAALVLVVQVPGPGSDDFVTLTSPTDGSELAIKFQPSGELDAEALVSILTQPRNALTKQYAKLFDMEGVEVDFREDGLRAVAEKAMVRKTGARGLRSILESVLLDTMYDLPSTDNVSKVVVDASVINGESPPILVYSDQRKVAPEE